VRSWCRPSEQSPAHPTPVQALLPSDQFFRKRFPTKPGLSLLITLGRRPDLLLDCRSVRCRFPRSRFLATLRIGRQFRRNPSNVTQYRASAHSMLRILMVYPLLWSKSSVMGGELLKESHQSSPSIPMHGQLFVSQRNHRIDPHRPPRWDVASERGDSDQSERCEKHRLNICRLDTKK
jgi:hypothetical protein